jgi:hypothetical protein
MIVFFWWGLPDAIIVFFVGGFIDPFWGYDIADGTWRGKPA